MLEELQTKHKKPEPESNRPMMPPGFQRENFNHLALDICSKIWMLISSTGVRLEFHAFERSMYMDAISHQVIKVKAGCALWERRSFAALPNITWQQPGKVVEVPGGLLLFDRFVSFP